MEDCSFMRITPQEMDCATISCYICDTEEVRDEIQRLAYDIYVALNEDPERIFLGYDHGKTDIEVHSMLDSNKKFQHDAIIHGYDDTIFLMEYLCMLARSELVHIKRH